MWISLPTADDSHEIASLIFPKNKKGVICCSNSFLCSGNFCRLLITFANNLDPDQDRQNVGPDLDPNNLIH